MTKRLIKTIVINPEKREVTKIEVPDHFSNFQEIVGGTFERAVEFLNKDTLYVNGSALLGKHKRFWWQIRGTTHLFCDNAFLIKDYGNHWRDAKSSVAEITQQVEWLTTDEARMAWGGYQERLQEQMRRYGRSFGKEAVIMPALPFPEE